MTTITKKIFALLLALACMTGASALAQSAAVSGAEATAEQISEALCAENITVSLPEDGGWFFSDDGESMRATGAARFSVTLTAAAGEALGFEYASHCSPKQQGLLISVDDQPVKALAGEKDWTREYVSFETDGEHTVTFSFIRKEDAADGTFISLRAFSLLSAEEQAAVDAARPTVEPFDGEGCDIEAPTDNVSGTLPLRITIGKDVNVNEAYLSDNGDYRMLSDLPTDGKAFFYTPDSAPGRAVAVYASLLDALTGVNAEPLVVFDSSDTTAEQADGVYTVLVTDESGAPVQGAMVQICDETTCLVLKTDENGSVVHTGARYPYEVHLLKAPKGYARVTETFIMPEEGGEIRITLTKE